MLIHMTGDACIACPVNSDDATCLALFEVSVLMIIVFRDLNIGKQLLP